MIEASPAMRACGEELSAHLADVSCRWQHGNCLSDLADLTPHDVVTMAYVLNELPHSSREALIDRLWALTGGVLLIVEPGTPAGWERLLKVREHLLAAGAHLLAPCPHATDCPVVAPDWCHFSRRVARTRLHRRVKGADVPWEDEKFCYLAAARFPGHPPKARLIAPQYTGKGRTSLTVCQRDGTRHERLLTKRDGALFKAARRLEWGDGIDLS